MTWRDVERWVARRVGGVVVTDKGQQLIDIDVMWNVSVSVKQQPAALRTGNLAFEIKLLADDGREMAGNFATSKAEEYVVVVGDQAYCWRTEDLRRVVTDGDWPELRLKASTVQANRAMGRTYVDAVNRLVPLSELEPLCLWKETIDAAAVPQ